MKRLLHSRNGHRHRPVDFSPPKTAIPRLKGGNPAAELSQTPVLWKLALSKVLATAAPFAGMRPQIVLHALGNLRAIMRAMMMGGLDPALTTFFVKKYNYPEKQQVLAWLRKRGFQVLPVEEITAGYLENLEAEVTLSGLPLFIVEDGGYFAAALHQYRPSLLSRVIGTVEQTSRGTAKLIEAVGGDLARIMIPVVSVPDSTLKKNFEPPFIADGILLSLTNLISRPMRQMKVLVLGYGVIGKALVERLVEAGADVTVYDPKLKHDPGSLYARFEVARDPVMAAAGKDLIIGASGRQSITPEVIDGASAGTYLASASSDQREIAVDYLEEITRRPRPSRSSICSRFAR